MLFSALVPLSKSGVVTLSEFCVYFGVPDCALSRRVFGSLDIDDSGELSFKGKVTNSALNFGASARMHTHTLTRAR